MRIARLVALACGALAVTAMAASPFEQLKGKMKEGMYEYKMDMDMGQMPGMPPGMPTKQSHTFQKCLTAQDMEKGNMGRGAGRDGKMPENCEVKDFKLSGNTASYTMECKPPQEMRAENVITFKGNDFSMDMKMSMNQRGQMMNMTQHMEGKYMGACK
jgi:hypothetical protein